MSFPPLTLFPLGQSSTKPGGGGATPTMKTHNASYSTPVRDQTNPNETKQNKTKKKTVTNENRVGVKPRRDSLELYFLFMGLQPLKPCLATLTANEWSRRLARSHVHNLATLTAPAKHLYHAYSTNKKHLPYIIPAFTLFTALVPTFTLFPIGRSPTKPGGGGATPAMKTHGVLFYTGPRPNQAKPN